MQPVLAVAHHCDAVVRLLGSVLDAACVGGEQSILQKCKQITRPGLLTCLTVCVTVRSIKCDEAAPVGQSEGHIVQHLKSFSAVCM